MKIVKNTIAIIILLLFLAFMCKEFLTYHNKKNVLLNTEINETTTSLSLETSNVIGETALSADVDETAEEIDELEYFNIKNDDKYYDAKINGIEVLKSAMGSNYNIHNLPESKKNILIEMVDIIARHKTRRWRDPAKDPEYLAMLRDKIKSVRFLGDSMISVMAAYNSRLEINDTFHTFKGKNIMEQMDDIDETTFANCDTVVLFNGGNLMHFSSGEEYVNSYNKYIDKIKSYNDKLDIYITSLCPVSKTAMEEDLKSPTSHNFHLAPILDAALKEELEKSKKARYIDTKWIVENYLYNKDGIHFKPEFYMTYTPYVLDYIEYIK